MNPTCSLLELKAADEMLLDVVDVEEAQGCEPIVISHKYKCDVLGTRIILYSGTGSVLVLPSLLPVETRTYKKMYAEKWLSLWYIHRCTCNIGTD